MVVLVLSAAIAPATALDLIDADEVRPGDRGICRTEAEGGTLVDIPVEVIGTVPGAAPQRDMVLIRLQDERFEHVGVAAGMSGSPVWIDGQLLGALAFGWSFAKEPVAGVTPFSHMQRLAEDPADAPRPAGTRPGLRQIVEATAAGTVASSSLDWFLPAPIANGHRAVTPVLAGGLASGLGASGWTAELWSRLGLAAAPVGGVTDDGGRLTAGAMVAAVLMTGDASMAAGGTVTHVDGDQVWAFGHPFLGGGRVEMPMATAEVVTFMASLASSFKVFNVGPLVGTFTQDRAHGIWGRIGPVPAMVPVRLEVVGDRRYDVRVMRDPIILPALTGVVVQTAHAARGRTFGDHTVGLAMDVEFEDGHRVELSEAFAGAAAFSEAGGWVMAILSWLEASVFDGPEIASVALTVAAEERRGAARIVDVVPRRRIVAPGERLDIRVRLQREDEGWQTERLELTVPQSLPEGTVDLVVADGASWTAYDLTRRPSVSASFEDDVTLLDRLVPSDTIVAVLERAGAGVVLPGGSVRAPAGVAATLQSGLGNALTLTAHQVEREVRLETDGPVTGAARIRLTVRRPGSNPEEDA
jgi:hypothetical protein